MEHTELFIFARMLFLPFVNRFSFPVDSLCFALAQSLVSW
jgi:hypothetical protein